VPQPTLRQQNQQIRNAIKSVGQEMMQVIATGTIVPAQMPTINIPFRNVGLVRGFLVKITASVANTGSSAAALSAWNAANVLSNVTLTDFDNYQRINTTGLHLAMLGTAKEKNPWGSAELATALDTPMKFGNNYSSISATASLAATTGTGTVQFWYWVPCAYNKSDLRGAIFAGVTNASAYLQLTPNPVMGSGATDGTLSVYQGSGSVVTCTSLTYTVYQVYIDQLPRYTQGPQQGQPILPPLDISTQYRLGFTSNTGITPSQDFPIPFSNFQDFLSLAIIYDQNGTLNPGTDLNYFSLTAANTLQLFKKGPDAQAFQQRLRWQTDMPDGSYLFDFRDAPISTNQSGNMQLNLNAITAAAGSQVLAGFESFAMVQSVLGAASLAAS
jgi:hypothetical protein